MKVSLRPGVLAALGALVFAAAASAAPAPAPAPFTVPVEYHKLPNGLKVVLSRDTTAPDRRRRASTTTSASASSRRTAPGFAHLFEHMMFQGSQNLGKMEFIKLVQSNGGILNGSTRFDFTNYFEVVPAHTLETGSGPRPTACSGLAITQDNLKNQQGVVKNEVQGQCAQPAVRRLPVARPAAVRQHQLVQRAQLLRRPEGPRRRDARDVAELLQDLLRAEQRGARRRRRLRPGADDGVGREVLRRRSRRRRCRRKPDISEPRQDKEKRATKDDPLATRPALAFGYHVPARNTPEYYAMGLIDQILAPGQGQPALPGARAARTG